MDLLISNTQLFTSQDINWSTGFMLITGGLSWCFYQLFGLSFWRHPFTAEDPLVSKWCNAEFLQICSDEERNTFTSWMTWGQVHFQQIFIFGWTVPFNDHISYSKKGSIKPYSNFLWQKKVSEAVCKHDWHNVRSYLIFNVWKFLTRISDLLCNDLNLNFQMKWIPINMTGFRMRNFTKQWWSHLSDEIQSLQ